MDTAPSPPANTSTGCLFVISTPIGNRSDFSQRAVDVLRSCSCIAVEDTRKVRRLLDPHGAFPAQVLAYHEHNESHLAPKLADRIERGESVALLSEAGTPLISDPGFRLVRECHRRGLRVAPVPGPCAAIAALSVSGLPSDSFLFLGFPTPKVAARRSVLQKHRDAPHTLIFYESTHRILKFLDDIIEALGPQRIICVAREMTKLNETIVTGPALFVRDAVVGRSQKGEFVVLVAKEGFTLE